MHKISNIFRIAEEAIFCDHGLGSGALQKCRDFDVELDELKADVLASEKDEVALIWLAYKKKIKQFDEAVVFPEKETGGWKNLKKSCNSHGY